LLCIDQINIDGGTLHKDSISPSVDSNPAWDIMDIMNNVKVNYCIYFAYVLLLNIVFIKKELQYSTSVFSIL